MNLEFCKEEPSPRESREAAALATEMLSWGQWTGEQIDFLTRVENMDDSEPFLLDVVQEMHSARERERNLAR